MNAQEPSPHAHVGPKPNSPWRAVRSLLGAIATVAVTAMVTLLLLEIGLRIASPGVGLEWRNYATDPSNLIRMTKFLRYDPGLGFVHVPNRMDFGFGPIGNRIHHSTKPDDPVPPLARDAILAVGASFTFGSEVNASESWPAQLEKITKIPVINAGNGNYGVDQIVLRAEKLVPTVKPRLVIAEIVSASIDFTSMSVASGAPKPYFDIVGGGLELRNVPVPPYRATVSQAGYLRLTLGYSYLVNWTLTRLGYLNWWQLSKFEHVYANRDKGTEISCLLMKRLSALSKRSNVPILVIGQYGSFIVAPQNSVQPPVSKVADCAAANGLAALNLFEPWSAIYTKDQTDYRTYFTQGGVGHFSPKGNRFVAEKIVEFLRASSLSNLLQP